MDASARIACTYPFAELPRRCVGLDGAEGLIQAMAGESDAAPPVHGVVVP